MDAWWALELLNGLFTIFACSEAYLALTHSLPHSHTHYSHSNSKTHLHSLPHSLTALCSSLLQNKLFTHYFTPWLTLNLIVWCTHSLKWRVREWRVMQWGSTVVQWGVTPLTGAVEIVGVSVVVWIVILVLTVALRVAVSRNTPQSLRVTWRQDLFRATATSLLVITVRELGFDHYMHHSEVVKITVLLLLSTTLLYIDVSRYTNNFTIQQFIRIIGSAVMYAVAAFPVAAVMISCVFLVITSVMSKLGGDPEHSTLVNSVVYYGVLYGPLSVVYWHAKRELIKIPYLPW